jgi:Zn finger protein HypA/HybF involved in hydrogenase expression
MTEPNKQEFVSASKDANKQPPAEAGQHSCKNSEAIKEGAVFDADDPKFREAFDAALKANNYPYVRKGELYRSPTINIAWFIAYSVVNRLKLYTSQTTATQAAVAAAMRKAEEVCEEQHMSWADDVWNHACNTCRNAIKKLTPAEANAALDAYVQEKCMEVAQAVMDYYLLEDGKGELHQEPIPTIVRDVLNKNREG